METERHLGNITCHDFNANKLNLSVFVYVEKFKSAGISILVLTFGEVVAAKRWLEETGCSFQMYADPERKVYNALQMGRSIRQVLSSYNSNK